ncbi:DUF4149 domain-containing protein [uncultured Campylobacter sp.]|uniref:DUF4149 domain-containing protein n=1 Tax=uncultured Campylobacter sp. TaxID=218934 RepID=UPI00260CE68F|nr:DUF4149 domain-containing protein [uncultured Campylobacter sp.]
MKNINFLLLASVIGIELFIGVVVASYIFYPPNGLNGSVLLDRFESGLIMAQIFLKFAYVLIFVSIVNFLYEIFSVKNKFKILKIFISLVILALSLLFLFYYTLPMLEFQKQVLGTELDIAYFDSDEFKDFHYQSELLVKVLLVFQVILYFLSLKTADKAYNKES